MAGDADNDLVGDDRRVMRRVASAQLEFDASIGGERPISGQLSVGPAPGYASCRLVGEADPAEVWAEGNEEYLYVMPVHLLRECGLDVVRDAEHGGPGHCNIVGARGISRSRLRQLLRQVQWVEDYAPERVSADRVIPVEAPAEDSGG